MQDQVVKSESHSVYIVTLDCSPRTDALSKTVKNEGQKPRWSQQDAFILVHKYGYSIRHVVASEFLYCAGLTR